MDVIYTSNATHEPATTTMVNDDEGELFPGDHSHDIPGVCLQWYISLLVLLALLLMMMSY